MSYIPPSFGVSTAMFIRPQRLVPSAWTGHIPFGAWLIDAMRPQTFVELGSHFGMSYAAFCQTVAASELPTRCYAVDTWQGDEHAGFYGDDVYNDLAAFNARHFAGFSSLLRTTFDEARDYFPDGGVDLLHIDGLHTYDAVKHDFETWLPKLSDRAVVLFHDTNVRERGFGVWRYWAEISQSYPHIEFDHSAGLGVLFVGREVPKAATRIVDDWQDPAARRSLKEAFANLGESVLKRWELQTAVSESARELDALRRHNVDLEARLANAENLASLLSGSVSYRVTAPLRAVRGWLPR